MKYIKSYKLYESMDDTLNTLREICFELSDIGYIIEINEYSLLIFHSEPFKYKVVGDVVERIKNYLGDKFLVTYVTNQYYNRSTYLPSDDSLVSAVQLYFKMK